jgi:hypothetical protein
VQGKKGIALWTSFGSQVSTLPQAYTIKETPNNLSEAARQSLLEME